MSEKIETYRDAAIRIKNAVLQSRYRAASSANAEQLNLYIGVGNYISANTRSGKWGSGAIEAISQQLQAELPGLRGFSPANMRKMRLFYEEWNHVDIIRSLPTNELKAIDGSSESDAPNAVSLEDIEAFLRVGFSHHIEIIFKCKDLKYSIGKLNLSGGTPDDLMAALDDESFDRLDVFPGIWAQSYQLPRLHTDPFDHLLVWEALTNDLTVLSADKKLRAYESEGLRVIS